MMAFKPWCDSCNTWHTEVEGHKKRKCEDYSSIPFDYAGCVCGPLPNFACIPQYDGEPNAEGFIEFGERKYKLIEICPHNNFPDFKSYHGELIDA